MPRLGISTQYHQTDQSRLVVSTSSTLGYESLGRGNRTAIFQPDSILLQDPSLQFGWPDVDEPEGAFWSTSATADRIVKILNTLISDSDSQWQATLDLYKNVLPMYDQGNSTLVTSLGSLR